ncbi:MAG TPA: MoaD/ThiS family protein [Candidatus Limnocylindria bacterium]|nr:MoaD/ThiS family protein [Candidatus Limnocylindria bacterium]
MLHGEARQYSGGRKTVTVDAGAGTVEELLARAGIPVGETAAYIVNGEQRDLGDPVRDGDTVEVLPAISGGR